MKLSEKAMLVTLSIGKWEPKREDKIISQKVADDNQIHAGIKAGKYMKVLMENEKLGQISTIMNAIRTYHYYVTFPWIHKGPQIMPSAIYLEYVDKLEEFNSQWKPLRDQFVDEYPQLIEIERSRRNGMFRESDYPGPYEIRDRFYVNYNCIPMPDTDDFRISIRQEDLDRLDQQMAEVQAGINKELWQRLHEVCSHLAGTLGDVDSKRFHESLVGNVAKLVDIMPKLNINNDPHLEAMRLEIKDKLTIVPVRVLKENEPIRKAVASEADAILKKMEAYS